MNISKVIIWTRLDGGLSVCAPCISKDDPPGYTEAEALARALAKDVPPDALNVQVVERKSLPDDLRFRNAWTQRGRKVEVPVNKAKGVLIEEVRRARKKKLEELDRDWMKAKGQKKEKEADDVEKVRQKLRDLPQEIADQAFETVDQVANYWPEDLPPRSED